MVIFLMKMQADTDEMADYIILKYRELIVKRYDYNIMSNSLNLPGELTPAVIKDVRNYFLNSIYPTPEKRKQIEEAFKTLGSYTSQPTKIWRLLGNMTSAVFKFGRHFPAALKAGFVSLQSFLDAKKLEKALYEAACSNDYKIPMSDEEFNSCIAKISRKDALDFLNTVKSLFRSLTNVELLEKTISILESVTQKMRQYPHIYSEYEVEAIKLGIDIIQSGYSLFLRFNDRVKGLIVTKIAENEQLFVSKVYGY